MGDKLTKLQEEHMASFAPLSRVVVTGGTHGDELAGVYLVQKGLVKQPEFLHRETFTAQAIVANPEASRKSCRFVDTDLNRCFTFESLSSSTANSSSYEIRRAKELNHLLGPKGSNEAVDFICDLHTTTANMGTCIIVDSEKDYLSCQAAHYLKDSDFKPLFQGDPIFQSFVSEDSICYEAQDPICPIFINEASYYSKGIAFWGTKIQTFEIASIKVSI
ncbi:ACY3 amidohydrolase, partial [Polypterus senegalus]